jgi:hypothetical protein
MNSKALELYLYMGSTEPVIKWLESENVQTQAQALERLRPLVQSNIMGVMSLGAGSLAGTSGAVKKIVAHFPESIPMDTEIKYSQVDLKKAFEDGKLYGDDELELNTAGRETAFEVWFEDVFEK